MKTLIIALALLAPVAAQADLWDLTCANTHLSYMLTQRSGYNVVKDGKDYISVNGIDEANGLSAIVFAHLLPGITKTVVPVDAADNFMLIYSGKGASSNIHYIDNKGNHPCTVNSFKAGE